MSIASQAPTRQDFTDGPIPEGYAKVVHIGSEGEIGLTEIMPLVTACNEWGQARPEGNPRAVVVTHPHGTTLIAWDVKGRLTVQSAPPLEYQ